MMKEYKPVATNEDEEVAKAVPVPSDNDRSTRRFRKAVFLAGTAALLVLVLPHCHHDHHRHHDMNRYDWEDRQEAYHDAAVYYDDQESWNEDSAAESEMSEDNAWSEDSDSSSEDSDSASSDSRSGRSGHGKKHHGKKHHGGPPDRWWHHHHHGHGHHGGPHHHHGGPDDHHHGPDDHHHGPDDHHHGPGDHHHNHGPDDHHHHGPDDHHHGPDDHHHHGGPGMLSMLGRGPPPPVVTEGADFLREPAAPQKLRGSMIVRPPGVLPPDETLSTERRDVEAP